MWNRFYSHFSLRNFSNRIERFRESGIYDELFKRALNPTRFGPDVGQTQPKDRIIFDVMNIRQMKGIFLFYLIFCSLTIMLFLIEMMKRSKAIMITDK